MPILSCDMCSYSRPSLVDAPGQVVGQTDYRKHLIVGLVCTYKDGKACAKYDMKPKKEGEET